MGDCVTVGKGDKVWMHFEKNKKYFSHPGHVISVYEGTFKARSFISDGYEADASPRFDELEYEKEKGMNESPEVGDWYPLKLNRDEKLASVVFNLAKEHTKRENPSKSTKMLVSSDVIATSKGDVSMSLKLDEHGNVRVKHILYNGAKEKMVNSIARAKEFLDDLDAPAPSSSEPAAKRQKPSGSKFNCGQPGCPGTKARKSGPCDSPHCPKKLTATPGGAAAGPEEVEVSVTQESQVSLEDDKASEHSEQNGVEELEDNVEKLGRAYEELERRLSKMIASPFKPDVAGLDDNAAADKIAAELGEIADNVKGAKEEKNRVKNLLEAETKKLNEIRDSRRLLTDAEKAEKRAFNKAMSTVTESRAVTTVTKWTGCGGFDAKTAVEAFKQLALAQEETGRLKAKESELRASLRPSPAEQEDL